VPAPRRNLLQHLPLRPPQRHLVSDLRHLTPPYSREVYVASYDISRMT